MSLTVEVPFTKMYNAQEWQQQRCLTDYQLYDHPELIEFVERFRSSFVQDNESCVYWFVPADFAVTPDAVAMPVAHLHTLAITLQA